MAMYFPAPRHNIKLCTHQFVDCIYYVSDSVDAAGIPCQIDIEQPIQTLDHFIKEHLQQNTKFDCYAIQNYFGISSS